MNGWSFISLPERQSWSQHSNEVNEDWHSRQTQVLLNPSGSRNWTQLAAKLNPGSILVKRNAFYSEASFDFTKSKVHPLWLLSKVCTHLHEPLESMLHVIHSTVLAAVINSLQFSTTLLVLVIFFINHGYFTSRTHQNRFLSMSQWIC